MNVAVLTYKPAAAVDTYTASASELGQALRRDRIRVLAGLTMAPIISDPTSITDRLSNVRREVEGAISERRSYIGDAAADELIARVRAIFDEEEWCEADPVPTTPSVNSTIRAIASIGGDPSLGVSERGNLTATWQDEQRSLSIEGTADGKLSWAYVVEGPDNFDLLGNEEGSLTDVLQAIEG